MAACESVVRHTKDSESFAFRYLEDFIPFTVDSSYSAGRVTQSI